MTTYLGQGGGHNHFSNQVLPSKANANPSSRICYNHACHRKRTRTSTRLRRYHKQESDSYKVIWAVGEMDNALYSPGTLLYLLLEVGQESPSKSSTTWSVQVGELDFLARSKYRTDLNIQWWYIYTEVRYLNA